MPEPDVNILRRAAIQMRATAAVATPGPWTSLDNGDRLIHEHNDGTDDFTYVVDEPISHGANAAHIAAWHPGVVLAVANWLDATAAKSEELNDLLGVISQPVGDPVWTLRYRWRISTWGSPMPDLTAILADWASLNLVAVALWVMWVEVRRMRRRVGLR